MAHARLNASSAERWINCARSPKFIEGIPRTTSAAAEEGTAAHAHAERCLQSPAPKDLYLGEPVKGFPKFKVTEEMADAVRLYLDTIDAAVKAVSNKAVTVVEKRFNLGWLGRSDLWGTNDYSVIEPFGLLQVLDFKYGKGIPVEVKNNAQLRYYALGAMEGFHVSRVKSMIVQPRCPHADGPVRSEEISSEELLDWGHNVLIPAAKKTEDPKADFNPGPWCKKTFCPGAPTCPALREQAFAVAQQVFQAPGKELPAPQIMDLPTLRNVIEKADAVKHWLNAVCEYAKEGLENGTFTSAQLGIKRVAGRADRSWRDPKAAEEFLRALIGDDCMTQPELLSVAQAEKVIEKEDKVRLAEFVQTNRGVQIVPTSDPREEIKPAQLEFKSPFTKYDPK